MPANAKPGRLGFGPASFCRLDPDLVAALADSRRIGRVLLFASAITFLASAGYGAAFGAWRAPQQALFSTIKMPAMIFGVTLCTAVINGMLAQAMGARLSFRQAVACMFLGFAVTSVLLASLSPVILLLTMEAPSPGSPEAMATYRVLLPAHTTLVAICGIAGQCRLYRLLTELTGSRRLAGRVLLGWILVCGLVGCELSWFLSPFLARPDLPVSLLNENAFRSNFFEYSWRSMLGDLR